MISNYKTAWRFLVKNPLFFIGISILLLILHEMRQFLPQNGSVAIIVWWMVFYQVLKRLIALFDASVLEVRSDAFSNYCIASTVVAMGAFIVITIYYRYIFQDYQTGDFGRAEFYFIVNWIYPFTFGLAGALGGTAVVAAVMSDRYGVRTTFERAKRTWDSAIIGMMTGPALFGIIAFVTVYMVVDTSGYEGAADTAISLVHSYLLGCVALISVILAGSVMLRAYMLVAPEHVQRRMHMAPVPRGMAERWQRQSQAQSERPQVSAREFGAGLGMLGIYNEAWSFLRQNYLVFGAFATLLFISDVVSAQLPVNPLVTLLPVLLVIYGLMRMFMFDDRHWNVISRQRPDGFGKFLIVVALMVTAVGTLALIGMVQVFGPAPQDRADETLYVLVATAMGAGALLLVGAATGTALPAAVAGDKCGLSLSYRRAVGTWWRLPLGLLYGPIMSAAVTALVVGLILSLLGDAIDFSSGNLHPVKLIGNFAFQWLFLYHVVLAIAAFTIAYQRIAPPHIKVAMGRAAI